MDDGSTTDLRRFASQPFVQTLVWYLPTYDLAALFEAWIEYSVNDGEEYVNMPLMGRLVPMRAIGDAPEYTPSGSGWRVSMQWQSIDAAPGAWKGQAYWPAHFPHLDAQDFSIVPTQGPQRSDIPVGLEEVRRRFRTRNTTYKGRLLMDQQTRDEFWTFYRDDLQHGLAYFHAPFSNSVVSETLIRARFSETPEEEPVGSHYWLRVTFDTMNAPMMSKNDYLERVTIFVNDYVEAGYVVDGYVGYYVIE